MKRALRTVLLAAPALALTLPTGAAHAATWSHADAVGDAAQVDMDPRTGEQQVTPGAGDDSADITRVTVRHAQRQVQLTLRVADVRADVSSTVLAQLRTPRRRYLAAVASSPSSFTFMLLPQHGRPSGPVCSGGSGDVDAATDTIRVRIPRSCLGDPAWVQAGVLLSTGDNGFFDPTADWDEPSSASIDDALRAGGRAQRPTLSPKVRVG